MLALAQYWDKQKANDDAATYNEEIHEAHTDDDEAADRAFGASAGKDEV